MPREESATAIAGLSPSQQQAVRETLDEVLLSPLFGKSKRYSALLEYVVLNSLAGNLTALKERIVGKEVFGRAADYDVANDPVVRIAAGEVRKRLGQFFSEHADRAVRIDLPTGGYAAEFRFAPFPARRQNGEGYAVSTAPVAAEVEAPTPQREEKPLVSPRASWKRAAVAAILLVVVWGLGLWGYFDYRMSHDFWRPLLGNGQAPLIVVGKTNLPIAAGLSLTQPPTAGRANLILDDAMMAAQLCSVFRAYSAGCNIVLAPATTLDYLRGKPLVFIGGLNNDWTMRMMPALRYQIESIAPADNFPAYRTIAEHNAAGDKPLWNLFGKNSPPELGYDYAIVARFHSDVTDSMEMIVAGLGPEGTAGARQFLSSTENLNQLLRRAPKGWKGENLEAVLQIDVVHASASRAEVVATNFW
jgi:hypothetical protein